MKIKTFTFILFLQLLTLAALAQKNAGLNTLLNKNTEFIFPQTPDKISAALNAKTVFYEDANEEQYAKWLTKSGLELYCSLGKDKSINEMFFDIPDDKFLVVSGLPFGLSMNKTTLQQGVANFTKYKAKKVKLGDDSTFSGGTKLTFKKEKHYVTLLFDSKNLLKSLSITTELIDPAAN
ncbi:hypothetical protein [Pedobacter nototheniae]|uniref:hypothetical protein n=1 Tax=Pedobacter nototheniae TaxID=2488994 RepID=UPI002931B78C|nr:hypothetical protein [Pedobacter nototheniae]